MTKDQAIKIAKTLDDITCFEGFMDALDGAINEGIEIWGMSEADEFIIKLRKMMENELKFREKLLEEL